MSHPSVLIVDDTLLNRKVLQIRLEKEGYQVQGTATAEEAWELLQTFRPSLILMDLELPQMSGLDLTRLIRREASLQNIPVIALSAHTEGAYREKALEAGCNEYLSKPVDARQLLQMLRSYPAGAMAEGKPQSPPPSREGPAGRLAQLRQMFLQDFRQECESLRALPEGQFDKDRLSKDVHRWIGCGTPAGFPSLSVQARRIDDVLPATASEPELRAYVDQLLGSVQEAA